MEIQLLTQDAFFGSSQFTGGVICFQSSFISFKFVISLAAVGTANSKELLLFQSYKVLSYPTKHPSLVFFGLKRRNVSTRARANQNLQSIIFCTSRVSEKASESKNEEIHTDYAHLNVPDSRESLSITKPHISGINHGSRTL